MDARRQIGDALLSSDSAGALAADQTPAGLKVDGDAGPRDRTQRRRLLDRALAHAGYVDLLARCTLTVNPLRAIRGSAVKLVESPEQNLQGFRGLNRGRPGDGQQSQGVIHVIAHAGFEDGEHIRGETSFETVSREGAQRYR